MKKHINISFKFIIDILTGNTKTELISGIGKTITSDIDLTRDLYDNIDKNKTFEISKNGKRYKITQLM